MSEPLPRESRGGFERQYRAHRGAVRKHLLYLTGDPALADDLTQETFGKLYERELGGEREPRNTKAWLLTVASNLAYNHFRAESRRTAREGTGAPIEAVTAQRQLDDVLDVRRVLAELEPRDRLVLMLRHSGFSYAEVAEATGVAASSIGTILARAQRRFREVYEGARRSAAEKE